MHTMLAMVGASVLLGCWLVWQAIIVLAQLIQSLLRLLLAFLLPIAVVVLLASTVT